MMAEKMEERIEKSNPYLYLPLFLVSAALVYWAFAGFFKLGVQEAKKKPASAAAQTQAQAVDLSLLYKPTPELAAQGKMLYAVNCASCHGPAGKGDGDRAPELSPRPRNFSSEKFKFGNAPSQLWNTIKVGSPGTAMASFELLPASDRIAIIHYVRSLIPNPANDPPEMVAQMSGGAGAAPSGGGPVGASADTAKAGPRIPIVLALRASARAESPIGRKLSHLPAGLGKQIYAERCVSCHGASGEGGEPVQKLAVFPHIYAKTPSLQSPNASWLRNKTEFEQIVVGGRPGKMMPGELLTAGELDALYRFVVELAKDR